MFDLEDSPPRLVVGCSIVVVRLWWFDLAFSLVFNGWEPGKTWYSVPSSLEMSRGSRWLDSMVETVLTLLVTGLFDLS